MKRYMKRMKRYTRVPLFFHMELTARRSWAILGKKREDHRIWKSICILSGRVAVEKARC